MEANKTVILLSAAEASPRDVEGAPIADEDDLFFGACDGRVYHDRSRRRLRRSG